MRNFLRLAEMELRECGLDQSHWGFTLRKYLKGRALRIWMHRSYSDMSNLPAFKERFLPYFGRSRQNQLDDFAATRWSGDSQAYVRQSADFAGEGE